ncbi:phosphoadenosine phosphosulfate reductase domain-containing protein [Lyngbya confervoides]|uniref:Phosphoadenosine phosphosulfate reductase family protein n=1 Tax=Lyngbya confervoides BDU141951 TaxID=1574623 RepID=A0ABD4SZW5_9CYAN|nr:phosphoadenosine phosphosulfate reductase family protein [Lyngbya confervoides]MCM1981996.1 phosphoadenosine phosphosulfate reductase family protein [Lyngbya confervoides BDU141951]
MRTLSLFEEERLTLAKSIQLSVESLTHYGSQYQHWAIAFSGGKDSSATVTLIAHLLESGKIPQPQSLTVLFADTRQELPPLYFAAMDILSELEARGIKTQVVLPQMDHRFFVYMLGRGIPPPSNTFRWCTPKLKVMSMEKALEQVRQDCGEKLLMITGVRIGESAARDQRIAMSCTKDGGECGQGWFQHSSADAIADTLAPLLHWRVCHVWDWLMFEAPLLGFSTDAVATVYGQDTAEGEEPINARTGCIGCPLVERDAALDRVIAQENWAYLAPLQKLRPLYWQVKKPQYRLRKYDERKKDGSLAAKQGRLGPLHLDARRWMLEQILEIQAEVNAAALRLNRPQISLINDQELARIKELIEMNTWPQKWDGTEERGDVLLPDILSDGSVQPLLFSEV